jgi:hypothetical protein
MERKGANDNGESLQRFPAVGGAAFAGDHALDIAFDRQCDRNDQHAGAGGDGHGIVQRDGFSVSRERDWAGERESVRISLLAGHYERDFIARCVNADGLRQRESGASVAGAQGDFVVGSGRLQENLAVMP